MSHFISTEHNANYIAFTIPEEGGPYDRSSAEFINLVIKYVNMYMEGKHDKAISELKMLYEWSGTIEKKYEKSIEAILQALHPEVEKAYYSFSVKASFKHLSLQFTEKEPIHPDIFEITSRPIPVNLSLTHAIINLIAEDYSFPADTQTATWVSYSQEDVKSDEVFDVQFHALMGKTIRTVTRKTFQSFIDPPKYDENNWSSINKDMTNFLSEAGLSSISLGSGNKLIDNHGATDNKAFFDLLLPINRILSHLNKAIRNVPRVFEIRDTLAQTYLGQSDNEDKVNLTPLCIEVLDELRGQSSTVDGLLHSLESALLYQSESALAYQKERDKLLTLIFYHTIGSGSTILMASSSLEDVMRLKTASLLDSDEVSKEWVAMAHKLQGQSSSVYHFTHKGGMNESWKVGQTVINVYEGNATILKDEDIHPHIQALKPTAQANEAMYKNKKLPS